MTAQQPTSDRLLLNIIPTIAKFEPVRALELVDTHAYLMDKLQNRVINSVYLIPSAQTSDSWG